MSVLINHFVMPKGCIYANDKDETEYCPMLNHDDVPFCQYIENEPEAAIGVDERPVYCPLEEQPEPCEDAVSRQALIDAFVKLTHLTWENLKIIHPMLYVVEKVPSATPQPKIGRWMDIPDGYKCSECGAYLEIDCRDTEMNFCPNCGSQMTEG